MKKLIIISVLILSNNYAHALNLDGFKESIRAPMNKYLGEETTERIIGKAPQKEGIVELPTIPKIQKSATDDGIYDKSGSIYGQGGSYKNLSPDKKRPFIIAYLKEIYLVTRNSEIKNEDLAKYLNVIEQGGSREGVYRAITNDNVYAALESYQDPISENLVEFVLKFSERFLNVSYDKEGMKNSNLYIVKRIIVDKALDVLDALANRPEDAHRWFAVFSSEMAKTYPGLLKGEARTSTDDISQLHWAKSVPWQHIKSEVTIRLHRIMNGLNS